MAVREPFMVKYGLNSSQYTLTPNFGEGIVIKELYVNASAADYLLIYIGKTLVGYWNIGTSPIGNNLFRNPESATEDNLYNYLVRKGIMRPYRVAEGETITFETENGNNFDLLVIYETHDAADINPSEPGGSKAEEYDLIHYVYPSTVATESTIDTAKTPSEFPAFPAGETVPAGTEIIIHGLIGLPAYAADDVSAPTQETRTKAIKFTYNRKVLFDENKVGIPFYGATSASSTPYFSAVLTPISPVSDQSKREPFLFPEPLVFGEGEELEIKIVLEQLTGSTIQLTSSNLVIGLIETVRPVR